jgi:3-methyladenine DNA glycosylase AlkD
MHIHGRTRVNETRREIFVVKKDPEYLKVMGKLEALSDPSRARDMVAWAGVKAHTLLGISVPNLRKVAKETGRNHVLAQELWASGVHEARLVACMIDDPELVTEGQLECWVRDFDSWDVCDQCCSNLFDKTVYAHQKAVEWSSRGEEYVRRAGFVLMATLAVHDKRAGDDVFLRFLPIIERGSTDERNFVKKAVNWALRQIGKRNKVLNGAAIRTAEVISRFDSRAARWVASDALKELKSPMVQRRLDSRRTR